MGRVPFQATPVKKNRSRTLRRFGPLEPIPLFLWRRLEEGLSKKRIPVSGELPSDAIPVLAVHQRFHFCHHGAITVPGQTHRSFFFPGPDPDPILGHPKRESFDCSQSSNFYPALCAYLHNLGCMQ